MTPTQMIPREELMAPTNAVSSAIASLAYNIHTSVFTSIDIHIDTPKYCAVCSRCFITTYNDEYASEITIPYGDPTNIPCINIRKMIMCYICAGLCANYPVDGLLSAGTWFISPDSITRTKSRSIHGLASLRFCNSVTIIQHQSTTVRSNKICACCRGIAWSYLSIQGCASYNISVCDKCFDESNHKMAKIHKRIPPVLAVIRELHCDIVPTFIDIIINVGLI